jgi:hypothetical protein
MYKVDFFSRRSRQTLHTVTAAAQENCTKDVDKYMCHDVQSMHIAAIALIKSLVAVLSDPMSSHCPEGKDEIQHEDASRG